MRTPLTVALTGAAGNRAITKRVFDLSLGSTSPGGFASVSLSFAQPITQDFLAGYDTVTVYDGQTGEVAGAGRLTDPGRTADSSGQIWQVTAIGEGPAHMTDTTQPYGLIETALDGFYRKRVFSGSATGEVGSTPDGATPTSTEAVVLAVPGGTVVANGVVIAMDYDRLVTLGFQLGGVGLTRLGGKADAGWNAEIAVYGDDGSPATADLFSVNLAVGPTVSAARVVNTDWTAGADVFRLKLARDGGAATVADDTTWISYYDIYVAARRRLKDGSIAADAAHGNAYVLASEVVADLLGRYLTRFDGANAAITTTSAHIDQLMYMDGVTPGQVVDDLIGNFEHTMTWHVWEANDAGLFRFEFLPWSTSVRYTCDVSDGFSSPSPASDLYNGVSVRYKSKKGLTSTLLVTGGATLPYTRTAIIDLGDEVGSAANAARAGAQFLLDHTYPPNSGSLRVARPIMDLQTGRMVKPWMIRPGNLIRVRGVRPFIDSLNATDRDGVTVFRVVTSSYSDSDGAAQLELDAYTRTDARELARLMNKRTRRR